MDWFSGNLIIHDPVNHAVLHVVPGITLIEAQQRLVRWKEENPGKEHFAMYHPYAIEVAAEPERGRATSSRTP